MKSQPRPLAKASVRSAKAFRKSSPSRLREKSSSEKATTKAAAPRLIGGLLIQSLRLLISSIPRVPPAPTQYEPGQAAVLEQRTLTGRAFGRRAAALGRHWLAGGGGSDFRVMELEPKPLTRSDTRSRQDWFARSIADQGEAALQHLVIGEALQQTTERIQELGLALDQAGHHARRECVGDPFQGAIPPLHHLADCRLEVHGFEVECRAGGRNLLARRLQPRPEAGNL